PFAGLGASAPRGGAMSIVSSLLQRTRPRLRLGAGVLMAGGALLLTARSGHLPDGLPIFHACSSAWMRLLPRSAAQVLRLPLLELAQLGAASAVAAQARRRGVSGWLRFWIGAFLTILVQAAFDSVDL